MLGTRDRNMKITVAGRSTNPRHRPATETENKFLTRLCVTRVKNTRDKYMKYVFDAGGLSRVRNPRQKHYINIHILSVAGSPVSDGYTTWGRQDSAPHAECPVIPETKVKNEKR